MAIKTIDLVINTSRGEQNVKKLHQLARQVEKTFGNLNKLKINIKTAPAQQKLTALQKEINKGNKKIDTFLKTANPGMRFFGNSIGKARDNLAAVRKAFDDATSATARQNGATTLLAGNFRKLNMEALAFARASGADPSKTIGNVSARIKEIQGLPRTIMAGNEAMTLLKRMQDMTVAGSKEFLEVSKAIGLQLGINANIQQQAARAAKPMTASTAFVSQEQLQALGRNKLIPPSMRLPEAGKSSGTFEIKSKPIEKAVKNIQKSSNKTANILTQQSAFGMLPPAGGTTSPINSRFSRANLGFGKNANPQGVFAMPGGATGRLKGAAGSAMIGGGFPALFGAGGISSAMGAVAGGIGGALAPGGGFAASILATAAAAQIEKTIAFRKELNKVNLELESMGIASTFSRKQIKDLAKEFKITNDEAIKLATTFKTFGAGQADMLLSAFGSREVFDTLSGLRTTEAVLGKIEGIREKISETTRQDLLQSLATKGSLETQLKLERIIFEQRKKAFVEKEIKKIGVMDIPKKFRPRANQQEFLNIRRGEIGEEFEKTNGAALKVLETQIKINEQAQFISEFQAPTEEIRELLNPMRTVLDLSTSIRTGFEESFKGIIKGTMSVQDAFRNMLGRIADHFLDTAARLAAAQLQKGFLSLFSGLFNFGGSSLLSSTPVGTSNMFVGRASASAFLADGGTARAGRSYIVGERGPEMFTPGVTGTVTPNESLGGSTNIVVNVDASGSSVEGDEDEGRALGVALSAAIETELIKQKRPGGLLA
jgi:hypothetical protein